MRVILCLIAAALVSAAAPASAASLGNTDASYLHSAMQSQLGRYALAVLAARNGSGAVKHLAQSVASNASSNNRKLTRIAKRYGVPPAKSPAARDSYHYSELSGLRGSSLNQRFMLDLRIDDEMRLSNVQREMRSGGNAQLRAYAKQRYAALRHELAALQHLGA